MFTDRKEAGQKLAKALTDYRSKNAIVLALPRGGVPVGYEVAKMLGCPLDTVVARKIGAPENPEFAIGAIAPKGVRVIERQGDDIDNIVRAETKEMERRTKKYKSGSYARDAKPDVVIVVDDGIATGKTAVAALRSSRATYPDARLLFAAPVGAPDSVERLRSDADEVVCLETPPYFGAVGEWYEDFPQTSDNEVVELLELAHRTLKK